MTKPTRLLIWITATLLSVALVLFAIGQIVAEQAQKDLIASKADQITTLRSQRDAANLRADAASTRADDLTRGAFAGIQSAACTQYRTLELASAFARLIYTSPTATHSQHLLFARFIAVPPAPKGCPIQPPHKGA